MPVAERKGIDAAARGSLVTSILRHPTDPIVEPWIFTRVPSCILKIGVPELFVRHDLRGHPVNLEAVLRIAVISMRGMGAHDNEPHWDTRSVHGRYPRILLVATVKVITMTTIAVLVVWNVVKVLEFLGLVKIVSNLALGGGRSGGYECIDLGSECLQIPKTPDRGGGVLNTEDLAEEDHRNHPNHRDSNDGLDY